MANLAEEHVGLRSSAQLTIARRERSVRRTSTLDMNRPDGVSGDLILTGIARDLLTLSAEQAPQVVAEGQLSGRVDWVNGRAVRELATEPSMPESTSLIGRSAASGFRAVAQQAVPSEATNRTPLYLLLDDIPAGVLVSGFATRRDGPGPLRTQASGNPPKPDLCAGWQRGGTMMVSIETTGRTPTAGSAPVPRERNDDAHAWHIMPALGFGGVRRRRRLDLSASGVLEIDAVFRDSYMSPDGTESAIHEYGLVGTIEPGTLRILTLSAQARVLPYAECPLAVPSAERLVGLTVEDLRSHVRSEFIGPSTCTHLNDMLRSLEDVVGLARHLDVAGIAA